MSGKETERVSGVSSPLYKALDCRSFWRAGSDDDFTAPAYLSDEKLEPSEFERARVHPKFLHSNATAHKWAFGAIAELLDNAIDETCNGATFVKVDRVFNSRDNSPALLFQDNGGGMNPQKIRHCMSLGFSSKKTSKTIGQYGNGFKTGTMRLGADVIVFSCSSCEDHSTQSIGLLSYTYLMKTCKNDTIVPFIDFKVVVDDKAVPLVYGSQDDWNRNLRTILDWSPFTSKEELMMQFKGIGYHGTQVIIYNLWYDDDGRLELDFDNDKEDIQLRDRAKAGNFSQARSEIMESHISFAYRYSLRAYASILYRKKFTSFSIILRGKPVEHLCIASELKFSKVVLYRPYVGKDEAVKMTIGFAKEAPVLGLYGFNIYHRNRLIMPFWKVFQEASCRGKCIIGVLEANFIEPAHDKQDFEKSMLFNRLEIKLKKTIAEYWNTHCHLIGYKSYMEKKQSAQREANKNSSTSRPNVAQQDASNQPTAGHSISSDQYLVEEPMNLQVSSPAQPVIGLASCFENGIHLSHPFNAYGVISGSAGGGSNAQLSGCVPEEHAFPCADDDQITMPEAISSLGENVNLLDSYSIYALSEENVKLFTECQQHHQKQAELKHEIEKLEEELQDVRTKCAILSSEIQFQKKRRNA